MMLKPFKNNFLHKTLTVFTKVEGNLTCMPDCRIVILTILFSYSLVPVEIFRCNDNTTYLTH